MKLCGADDCECFVEGTGENMRVRGSGGSGVPMDIEWLLYPRGAEVSMSALGTRYWTNGSGHKLFTRLPFKITRNSLRTVNTTSQLAYSMGEDTMPAGVTALPDASLRTDPEFQQYFDSDASTEGIVTLDSTYDSYDIVLEVLYVNIQNYDGFVWGHANAMLFDTSTSRHLEVMPRTLTGDDSTPAARVNLHAHRGYKAALHAAKVPMVRLPFHGTHGHSWSFVVVARSLVAATGGFDTADSPQKAKFGVYGLLSVYP